ncbi:MAG: ORF6N domain-containing protein [Verrucomicrobiota bacterium]|jgi:hypothetical protein
MKMTKPKKPIEALILNLRSQKVILDTDLAELYGVPTKVFNQAVKRNAERFPEDFCFRLTLEEAEAVQRSRSQFVTLKRGQNLKYAPCAFTEHGAIMAATILNSPEAVAMSVFVVRAFMQMRERLIANPAILKRLAEMDKTLLEHDSALRPIWTKLQPLLAPPPDPPRPEIGFHIKEDPAPYRFSRKRRPTL